MYLKQLILKMMLYHIKLIVKIAVAHICWEAIKNSSAAINDEKYIKYKL